jgi:hypothetical protein
MRIRSCCFSTSSKRSALGSDVQSRMHVDFAISLQSNLHSTGYMQHVQARQDVPLRQVLLVRPRHQRAQALPLRARFKQNVRCMSARTCRFCRAGASFRCSACSSRRCCLPLLPRRPDVDTHVPQHLLLDVMSQRAGAVPLLRPP